jgi:phage gpG-like protein
MAKTTSTPSVTVSPTLESLRNRNKRAVAALGNFKPAYQRIGVFLDQWVQQNFRQEGGVLSDGPWPPFARGGRVVMSAQGTYLDTSAKLLQDTGRLRASFDPFVTKRNVGIGSDLPYARAHHEGIGDLPERRLLPEQHEVRRPVADIFNGHVRDGLRELSKKGGGR